MYFKFLPLSAVAETFRSDRDVPAVVSFPLTNTFNSSSLDKSYPDTFSFLWSANASENIGQFPLLSHWQSVPIWDLLQSTPPSTTCQTRLYLTRQGNDGICHLCKLFHNLIWLAVSDEADSTWPPLLFLFSQTLLAHLSDGTTGFDRTKDALGEKVAGWTMMIIISIYLGLLSLV